MLDPDLSKRHFTDSARRVVRHISERSSDRGMHAGELSGATADMLAILSMLHWERKVGRVALERVLVDCDKFARELDAAIDEEGRKTRRPDGPILKTLPSGQSAIIVDRETPLKELLDRAEHEALALGHNWVGSEHLMLAAIQSSCPHLQELLRRHNVSHEIVRASVVDLLTP